MKRSYPHLMQMLFLPMRPGSKSSTIVLVGAKSPWRYSVACCCSQRRRKDGTCRHSAAVLAALKPWYRQRCRIEERSARA